MTERQELGSLEAMLFAHAEPVETARLADALRLDTDETAELLQKLQKLYDERESGMVLLYFEPDRWQMTTRPYYGEMVKRILDTRRNAGSTGCHRLQSAGLPQLYRAGARRGFLVHRHKAAGQRAD